MRKLIALAFSIMTFSSWAQSFESIYEKSLRLLYKDCLDLTVEMTIFKNSYLIGVETLENIRYQKCGNEMLVSTKAYEHLVTKDITLIADHADRMLMLAPTLNGKGAVIPLGVDSIIGNLKSVLGAITPPTIMKDVNGLTGFSFKSPDNALNQLELWFDDKTNQLRKMIIIPVGPIQTTPALMYKLSYSDKIPDKSVFSLSRYGQAKKKIFTPSGTYRNYSILNQL